jgi:hypothetical protein
VVAVFVGGEADCVPCGVGCEKSVRGLFH